MAKDYVIETLLQMDQNQSHAIITNAWYDYVQRIGQIAEDIYDSCIEDYYGQYTPSVYTRHGNIEGFNLYSANDIMHNEHEIEVSLDPGNLLPYAGRRDKRAKVLASVMKGLRGARSRKTPRGWPMTWYTRYPNAYSVYSDWSSTRCTMNEIFYDFMDNVLIDTEDLFWKYVERYI